MFYFKKLNFTFITKYIYIINILTSLSHGIICKSYHKYYEEFKKREIVESTCYSSTPYCVKAIYNDPNPSKMNGISYGCDKNDCIDIEKAAYGWDKNGCKKSSDYGKNGLICCCSGKDYCNTSSTDITISLMTTFIFLIFFITFHNF
uniref:Activin_recp domain-containing protein n=1 Tax=Strongyloides papillosus TaxID=174720 RepID=A0A0N5B5W2_STREA